MSQRTGRGIAVILAAVGLACVQQGVVAHEGLAGSPDQLASFEPYVEVPGSMEFSGRLIVKPLQADDLAERGVSERDAAAIRAMAKALLSEFEEYWYEPLVDHHVIMLPNGVSENELAAQLMATGLFDFAEPDWILYPIGCPNDSRFGNQWHHNSNRMNSCAAWNIETGTPSVGVGICDTGIQTSHPDVQQHRLEGYNAVDRRWESNGGNINNVHPHGTMTTGCAAANGNNGTGIAGVGWNLSHRMMRVSNSSNGSSSQSTLTHAALTSISAGDRVANVSYSGVNSNSVRSTATQIKNMGGLLTWSAGNDGRNLNWGNRDNDDVIVVGATTSSDSKASWSAYGPSVDLVAPGASVYTLNTGSGYAYVDGTSFSAPLTAGLIALIWSADPSLTPDEVETILKAGCDDLGSSGVDNTFGYGRIDSFNSLSMVGDPNTPPELTVNSPTNGGDYDLGSSITFDADAIDDEDGDISSDVTWTSSRDGYLGQGSFSRSDLSEGTHFIDVEVVDSNGASDLELVIIDVIDGGGVPTAPTPIRTQEGTPNELTFSWNDRSDNETGFRVFRMEKVNGSWTDRTIVANTGPNVTSYTEVVPEGIWRYQVRALGSNGNSNSSSWRKMKVARANGHSSSVNGSTVTVVWNDNSGLEDGYRLQRQEQVNGVWTNTTSVGSVPANSESFQDQPGSGRWRYRIQTTSGGLNATWTGYTNRVTVQ